jgi:glucose-6-phosphate 1-dehydrogenase
MTDSTTIVIFGASGDLNRRKLIPALFNLFRKGRLAQPLRIIGFSGTPYEYGAFRQLLRQGLDHYAGYQFTDEEWAVFSQGIFYVSGNIDRPEDVTRLKTFILEQESGPANRLFYLATPPQYFAKIATVLGQTDMVKETDGVWRRVIVEKPFGTDLQSAMQLNTTLHQYLSEEQIYRIDHYLGKETVQNILVFRFGNTIFEPLWNHNFIASVQITVSETDGVGSRAGYYDTVGILPDMFQNHLLTLLTLIGMEPPSSFKADALHNEYAKVLSAVCSIPPEEIAKSSVRGQYRGYGQEPKVAPGSQASTFAAVRFFIDNWRWQGVPFFLRSGKKLAEKTSRIVIQFRCPPHLMFPLPPDQPITPNALVLCLQPDEGIHLRFEAKVPDTVAAMRTVDMSFHYAESFGPMAIPEAYERLLLDALNGDLALFMRADSTELAWQLIDPILSAWRSPQAQPLIEYAAGSWGPTEADDLIARSGMEWLQGCGLH